MSFESTRRIANRLRPRFRCATICHVNDDDDGWWTWWMMDDGCVLFDLCEHCAWIYVTLSDQMEPTKSGWSGRERATVTTTTTTTPRKDRDRWSRRVCMGQFFYGGYTKFIKTNLLLCNNYTIMRLSMPCGSVPAVIMVVKTAIVGNSSSVIFNLFRALRQRT